MSEISERPQQAESQKERSIEREVVLQEFQQLQRIITTLESDWATLITKLNAEIQEKDAKIVELQKKIETLGEEYQQEIQQRDEVSRSKRLAKDLELAFVNLTPSLVEGKALRYITQDLAIYHNCMPIKAKGHKLMVAIGEPGDPRALQRLQWFTECKIIPVVATPSAIRKTQIHFWGEEFPPSKREGSEGSSVRIPSQRQNPRIVALVSATPDLTGKCLAANLAAILNREKRRVHLVDLITDSRTRSSGVSNATPEKTEWIILTIPMDKRPSYLDWVIRADEAILVVSPYHLQGGHDYVEAVFGRLTTIVKRQWTSCPETRIEPRALEFSVICAQIDDFLQGFRLFDQMEKTIHDELNMREAGVDIILHYLGGILKYRRNLQEAERLDIPLTILKPHSPASQCMNHIAHSLLKPTHARNPRICLRKASRPRFLAWCRSQKNPFAKASDD